MRYIIGILLIAIFIKPSIYACSFSYHKYEPELEIVKGIGGECYYKLIPPLETAANTSRGETEFYLKETDSKAIFSQQGRYPHKILCAKDATSNKIISYVKRKFSDSDPDDINDNNWLSFYVNGQIVKSYSPIDIIERENNFIDFGMCGRYYLQGEIELVQESLTSNYIYQVTIADNTIISFDPVTGEKLTVAKSLRASLMDSVYNNDLKKVQNVLAQGVNPNQGTRQEGTPLHLAAELGFLQVIEELLQAEAKLDFKHKRKYSRCDGCEEIEVESWEMIDREISGFPIPHHPLYIAVVNEHFEVVESLVAYGVDVNARGYLPYYSNSHSLEAATRNNSTKLINYLISNGANINDTDALEIAIEKLNLEAADLLLDLGADIQQIESLCIIAENRNKNIEGILQMARLLREAGANINATSCWENTPLITTISQQDGLLASFFIENGANIHFVDSKGGSALYYASVRSNKYLVKLLLANGANPNAIPTDIGIEDKFVKPPPLFAASNEIKQLLLDYGADVNITSITTGNNALQHELFKPYGFFDFIQSSSLHKERTEKLLRNIQFLLDVGINTAHKNNDGKTFLDLVKEAEVNEAYQDFVAEIKNMIMVSP